MAEIIDGNFAFLATIHPRMFDRLYEAEQNARINYEYSGQLSRKAMELFVDQVIDKKGLEEEFSKRNLKELNSKLMALRDESLLRSVHYLAEGESLADKPILPEMGEVSHKTLGGEVKTVNYYDFLRWFGNRCSHDKNKDYPWDMVLNYENIINCLKGYHLMLRRYYKSRIGSSVEKFDENIMPIADFHVYDSYIPDDSVRTGCEREFLAFHADRNEKPDGYALIRMYNKASMDENFMLRNQTCFVEARRVSEDMIPEGMAITSELVRADSNKTSKYLICYQVSREIRPLSSVKLEELTLKQRLRMCEKLASSLEKLHNSETPIFHRMLNHDCIFVYEGRRGLIPVIIKFDYAKIQTVEAGDIATVQKQAEKANELMKSAELNQYLPPEWNRSVLKEGVKGATGTTGDAGSGGKVDWAKVDIYSLGVLMANILLGSFSFKAPKVIIDRLEELADEDEISDEIVELIDGMLAESPDARFSMKDVQEILEEEV